MPKCPFYADFDDPKNLKENVRAEGIRGSSLSSRHQDLQGTLRMDAMSFWNMQVAMTMEAANISSCQISGLESPNFLPCTLHVYESPNYKSYTS